VLTALIGLGLSETEAEVYVFLATAGPQKGLSIAEALKLKRQQLYCSVKSLRGKGLLNVTVKRASRFSVVPFEKALDLLVKARLEKAQCIEQNKEEILTQWHTIINDNTAK